MAGGHRARRKLPGLRTPGAVCEPGERLLSLYEETARLARAAEGT
ncbi:hypothetical protein ACPEIC_09615 [Stenotrophomonas sp. NPDC087984]